MEDQAAETAAAGGADEPAVPAGGDGSGVDLARTALAQARAAARANGVARRGRTAAGRREAAARRSGSGPDDRDPQPLRRAVDRLLAERGWETEAAVHGVVARWDQIVGADVAEHCRPDRFVDGRLTVLADSTAWATQLRLLTPQVMRRLDEEVGRGTVTALVVRGPLGPSWRHGRRSVTGSRGPRDTYG
jgi:predicted nucleic acid-binding Zn ribbon protein